MVSICVKDRLSSISNCDARAWNIVRCVCRARPGGYQYMPQFKSGSWDGYINLASRNSFPTGLLRDVIDALRDANIEHQVFMSKDVVCIRRKNITSGIYERMLYDVALRPYQLDAIRSLASSERGIAQMATNSGKTLIIAALIKLLRLKSLVVVNSKELLYQTSERLFEYLGCDIGIIGDAHRAPELITVATIQTLQNIYDDPWFKDVGVIAVDECHHIGHNKTFDVLMKISGWYRYGFSGTPLDRGALNDLKLIACTGPVKAIVTNADLIQSGNSARPIVHFHSVNIEDATGVYSSEHDSMINDDARNLFIANIALEEIKRGPVIVFVKRKAHAENLMKHIGSSGIYVNGYTHINVRMATLDRVRFGENIVVVATPIFDEGVDVPALHSIILADGGKSHIKLLQRIGRGLRRKNGDNTITVHDFIDSCNVSDKRKDYMLNHTEERLDVYEKEGFEVVYDSDN